MASFKKNLQLLEQEIPNEKVIAAVGGQYEAKIMGSDSVRSGVMAATNRRVVFYAKKLGGYDFESFPYENISSVERGKNMMGKTVTLYASGNKVHLKWIQDGDVDAFVRAIDSRAGKQAEKSAPTAASTDDIPAQIEKLSKLKDSGAITQEEYNRKKTELLNKM